MQPSQQSAKDPAVGAILSLCFPGLGHLYAGNGRGFVGFLLFELFLLTQEWWLLFVVVHIFQSVAAAGAVKLWNREQEPIAGIDVPPPPPVGARRASVQARLVPAQAPTATVASPPPPQVELGPDEFLGELQSSWREHRTSSITARQFADRKWRAIRAVRVEDRDEGEALVAAAKELGAAGVLTSEEIGQLEARVTS